MISVLGFKNNVLEEEEINCVFILIPCFVHCVENNARFRER
jgi:hypothetical protein